MGWNWGCWIWNWFSNLNKVPEEDPMPPSATKVHRVSGRAFPKYQKLASSKQRKSILYLPMLHPQSRIAVGWSIYANIIDMTYTAFVVPLSMAFNTVDPHVNSLTFLDIIGNTTYFIDIFMSFHTGFIARWDLMSVAVLDGKAAAKMYLKHGGFTIDVLAFLPVIIMLLLWAFDSPTVAAQVLMLLKLLRLLRVIRLMLRIGKMDDLGGMRMFFVTHFDPLALCAFHLALSLLILINLMGCLWFWLAALQGLSTSWIASVDKLGIDLVTGSAYQQWLCSIYFATTTITTIGYGDITPQTSGEVALATIFMLLAVTYFGYLISSVTNMLQNSGENAKRQQAIMEKMQGVEGWMGRKKFTKELKRDIRGYYAHSWAATADPGEAEYFADLPAELRAEVVKSMMAGTIGDALFGDSDGLDEDMKDDAMALLSSLTYPIALEAYKRLFDYNDNAESFYILDEGQMIVPIHGSHKIRFIAPAIISLSALFASDIPACRKRLHTVETLTNCRLWEVNCAAFEAKLMDALPEVYLCIAKRYKLFVDDLLQGLQQWPKDLLIPMQLEQLNHYTDIHIGLEKVVQKALEAKKVVLLRSQELGVRREKVLGTYKSKTRGVNAANVTNAGATSIGGRDNAQELVLSSNVPELELGREIIHSLLPNYKPGSKAADVINKHGLGTTAASVITTTTDGGGGGGTQTNHQQQQQYSNTNVVHIVPVHTIDTEQGEVSTTTNDTNGGAQGENDITTLNEVDLSSRGGHDASPRHLHNLTSNIGRHGRGEQTTGGSGSISPTAGGGGITSTGLGRFDDVAFVS